MSQLIERPPTKSSGSSRRPAAATGPAQASRPLRPYEGRKPSLLGDAADDLLVSSSRPRRRGFVLSPFVRMRICAVLLAVIAAAIIVQLFTLQVQDRFDTKDRPIAKGQLAQEAIQPRRGLIRDSNSLVLASNTWVYDVYAAPQGLSESQIDKNTTRLMALLPGSSETTLRKSMTYTDEKHTYNMIGQAVSSDVADSIMAAKLPNIYFDPKPRRTYPNGTMLSGLLGFANNENQGAYGVEGFYNKELHGTAGTRLAERDGDGNPIVLGQVKLTEAQDGADVTLTIDSSVQMIVERELQKGVKEYQAEKGMAIVADPKTGAILAWASYPNYNPNEFYKTDPNLLRDPLVSDVYEPGSTFKILTAAIGIDTGAITPESNAGSLPGCVIKYTQRICNYNSVGYSNQTPIVTLEHSSNVGAMWIAERYGPTKYYDYLQRFGIGATTNIDLGGEGEGIFRTNTNKNWIPLDFEENAFGQSVAVTPIQLLQAVSAVANGGKLMQPYVVSRISRGNELLKETKPTFVRQVISPQSAKTTTDMLVQAVQLGETRLAAVKGYRIAGKTGTTTLFDNSGLTVGSTIAYAPADNPRFIVLVRFDKTKTTPWGSNSAAPVVSNITEQLFTYYQIPPTEPIKK